MRTTGKAKPDKRKAAARAAEAEAARPVQAWDRRDNETPVAFDAFTEYRKLGAKRSLERVREKIGKSAGYMRQLEEWSSKHQWVARVTAWDEAEYQKREEEDEKARKRGRITERANRRTFLAMMESKLKDAIEYVDLSDPDSVRAMIAMFDKVMSHSRQEFNDMATAKTALTDPTGEKPYQPFDPNKMSDEDMEAALAQLFGKVTANGG